MIQISCSIDFKMFRGGSAGDGVCGICLTNEKREKREISPTALKGKISVITSAGQNKWRNLVEGEKGAEANRETWDQHEISDSFEHTIRNFTAHQGGHVN